MSEANEITVDGIQNARRKLKESQERIHKLREAAAPLVEYLREHGSPHAKVIVQVDRVDFVEGMLGFVVPTERKPFVQAIQVEHQTVERGT